MTLVIEVSSKLSNNQVAQLVMAGAREWLHDQDLEATAHIVETY